MASDHVVGVFTRAPWLELIQKMIGNKALKLFQMMRFELKSMQRHPNSIVNVLKNWTHAASKTVNMRSSYKLKKNIIK